LLKTDIVIDFVIDQFHSLTSETTNVIGIGGNLSLLR